MIKKNVNNYVDYKEIAFLSILYISLLIGFYFNENSTGGAILDYQNQKIISIHFSENFFKTFLSYDTYPHRHSPVLIIFLSFFENLKLSDESIRLIHLHICLLLPFFFFKCLKLKFGTVENKILYFLTGLIFLSPTFRSLSIWPDSRILGLTFFVLSVFYFLKFQQTKKFVFVLKNIIFLSLSAYISPNFSVFSIFFFVHYLITYKFLSKEIFLITIFNLILAIPAIYYVFILDVNFFLKSAAVGRDEDKIIFYNISNDLLISISMIFFYFFPFLITKIIKFEKISMSPSLFFTLVVFIICIFYFDYNTDHTGGGIFLKISQIFFENNFFFFFTSLISLFILWPYLANHKLNLLIFVLILINNPQYTIYHKYFDPFLLIIFFTIFLFKYDLKKIFYKRLNYLFIYSYFIVFLILNIFKFIWIS